MFRKHKQIHNLQKRKKNGKKIFTKTKIKHSENFPNIPCTLINVIKLINDIYTLKISLSQ